MVTGSARRIHTVTSHLPMDVKKKLGAACLECISVTRQDCTVLHCPGESVPRSVLQPSFVTARSGTSAVTAEHLVAVLL